MTQNDSVPFGVAILPPAQVRDIIIKIANEVHERYPLTYLHDGERFHPHLTLFQTKVMDRAAAVEAVASSPVTDLLPPFEYSVLPRMVGHFQDGFLFLYCEVGRGITALHERLARSLHPYVARNEAPIAERESFRPPPSRAAYAREYGYALCFEEYRPHITIGRLAAGEPSHEDLSRIGVIVGSEVRALRHGPRFVPEDMVVYDVGIDGAAIAIHERFPLSLPSGT